MESQALEGCGTILLLSPGKVSIRGILRKFVGHFFHSSIQEVMRLVVNYATSR